MSDNEAEGAAAHEMPSETFHVSCPSNFEVRMNVACYGNILYTNDDAIVGADTETSEAISFEE